MLRKQQKASRGIKPSTNLLAKNLANYLFAGKQKLVYRSYWGRSSLYKNILHISFILLSVVVFITGVSSRLAGVTVRTSFAQSQTSQIGNVDLLEQGGSIQTLLVANPNIFFKVSEYTIQSGDKLDAVAQKFSVTKDTIKWANLSKIDYYSENLKAGDTIQIPEINGVLYEVKDGEDLDDVIAKTSGDRFQIIEINQLQAPSYTLEKGRRILIPNGKLPPPPPPASVQTYTYLARNPGRSTVSGQTGELNGVILSNPLSSPDCAGYGFSRGFAPWHYGVDLGKAGGCPVSAIADGTVEYSGWSSGGEGYNVRINHGNGVYSFYFHSDGNIWVKRGDVVTRGQNIMYMGCTGNCTGTHLHFGIRLNGAIIDPAPYVPY